MSKNNDDEFQKDFQTDSNLISNEFKPETFSEKPKKNEKNDQSSAAPKNNENNANNKEMDRIKDIINKKKKRM